MKTKYFKKVYSDRTACGVWYENDAINYNEPADKNYLITFTTKLVYDTIKQDVKVYYENEEKQNKIIYLKEKIYIRQQINEDYTELQDELDDLI